MLPVLPGLRLSAHVEVFKADDETGEQVLVHTSRPCPVCQLPLDGKAPVVPMPGDRQAHARCVA